MSELQYNPPFVPGDILKIDFPERSIDCLITASADAGAVEEVLSGHLVRYYHALYFSDADGFVHCTCMEDYLKEHVESRYDGDGKALGGARVHLINDATPLLVEESAEDIVQALSVMDNKPYNVGIAYYVRKRTGGSK